MSDRSDDTGQTPEVSGSGSTGKTSETQGGEAPPPPTEEPAPRTGDTATDDATAPPATDETQVAPAVATDPLDHTPASEPTDPHPAGAAVTPTVPAAPHDTDRTALLDHPGDTAFLTARGLSATGRQGPIFTDIHLTAHLGQLVAVSGDGGDGRTSLLLALTGRFAHHDGTLEVDGQTKLGQIRRRFTIAQAGPPIRFEPYATVGACIKETTTVSNGTATRANISAWLDRLAVGVDTGDTFGFLPRIDQIRFAIACAAAARTPAIAVDDADTGLDTCGSERVFDALRTVADAGQLVIAACTRSDPPADTIVDLRDQHPTTARTPHHEDRPTHRQHRRERTRNGGHR